MRQEDKSAFEKYNIDLLQISHIKKIAEMKLSKDKYEKQLEKTYVLFKDVRVKQKFINQLKIFIELKSISEQELIAHKFDFHQFKNLLIKKSELIHKIYIKNKRTESNNELFLRNQVSLQYLERKLNLQACIQPYRYSLQSLISVKDEIVSEGFNKHCEEMQMKIEEEPQQRQYILEKHQSLLKELQQKHIQIRQLNQSISNAIIAPNIEQVNLQKLHSQIQSQKQHQKSLILQLESLSNILSNQQSFYIRDERIKLKGLIGKTAELKQTYSKLKQQYQSKCFNMKKLLQKSIQIPQIYSNQQFQELQSQLNKLKQTYDLIQQQKRKK